MLEMLMVQDFLLPHHGGLEGHSISTVTILGPLTWPQRVLIGLIGLGFIGVI